MPLRPLLIRFVLPLIALLSPAILCLAQDPAATSNAGPSPSSSVLIVRVQGPDGASFHDPADVMLSRAKATGVHQSTGDTGQTEFSQLGPGDYFVVVSAPGYKPSQDQVTVENAGGNFQVVLRLDPVGEERAAASPLAPAAVSPKLQKDASKGIDALHAARWDDAQQQFEELYKRASDDAGVNYLLGYTFLEKAGSQTGGAQTADFRNAERYLMRAISIDAQSSAAFAAMGQLRLEQENLADAVAMFERAVSLDAENWSAHWTLATTYLKQREYEKARLQAEDAVKTGNGAANGAEFVVGQAWAGSGDIGNAVAAFQSFLRDAPTDASGPAAKAMIATLQADQEAREKSAAEIRAIATASLEKSALASGSHSPAALPGTSPANADLALPVWAPLGVDETRPAVASGATCSLSQVVQKAGLNIQNLVTNVGNIDASEETVHEQLNERGEAVESRTRHYDYLASFDEIRPGQLTMNELRNGSAAPDAFTDKIAASGLTSMALVFHPYIRDDFQMICEGLGDWHGHATWIVYFRQREGKPGRISGYSVNGSLYPLALKGRAWITADSYQVAHIETDLVAPMPQIQLTLQHMSVNYAPVHFRARGTDVWLPSTADMYFEFRRQRLHTRDSFSRYKFFSVGSSQKINNPPPEPPVYIDKP